MILPYLPTPKGHSPGWENFQISDRHFDSAIAYTRMSSISRRLSRSNNTLLHTDLVFCSSDIPSRWLAAAWCTPEARCSLVHTMMIQSLLSWGQKHASWPVQVLSKQQRAPGRPAARRLGADPSLAGCPAGRPCRMHAHASAAETAQGMPLQQLKVPRPGTLCAGSICTHLRHQKSQHVMSGVLWEQCGPMGFK